MNKVREEITDRYENGNKKSLVKYKGEGSNEVLVKRIDYSQNGDIINMESYNSKGQKDGQWIRSYYSGEVKDESNYRNGRRHGDWNFYFRSGKIRFIRPYKYGNKHGEWIGYYESGQIKWREVYKDGYIKDGVYTYYNEDGSIEKVIEYKNQLPDYSFPSN